VTSLALDPDSYNYHSGQGQGQGHLKLTSYSTTFAVGDVTGDKDYYKSRRHNMASYDDVNMTSSTGACFHDDAGRRHCVEHIYESPKFDRKHIS